MNLERFKTQHKEILAVSQKISFLFDPRALKEDASQVRDLLSVFYGKLKMHLIAEDKNLYPSLLSHDNFDIRQKAGDFSEKMSAFSKDFNVFLGKWSTKRMIQENPLDFITESEILIAHLTKRISREDNELFPLVEKLDG